MEALITLLSMGMLFWICGAEETDVLMPAPLGLTPPVEIILEAQFESDTSRSVLPEVSDAKTICTKGNISSVNMEIDLSIGENFFQFLHSRGFTVKLNDSTDLSKMYVCPDSGANANVNVRVALRDGHAVEIHTLYNEKTLTIPGGTQLSTLVGSPIHFSPEKFNLAGLTEKIIEDTESVFATLEFPRFAITGTITAYSFEVYWWAVVIVNTLLKDLTPIEVDSSTPVVILYKARCAPIYENCYSEIDPEYYEKSVSIVYSATSKDALPTHEKASLKFQSTATIYMPNPESAPTTFFANLYPARSAVRPACA